MNRLKTSAFLQLTTQERQIGTLINRSFFLEMNQTFNDQQSLLGRVTLLHTRPQKSNHLILAKSPSTIHWLPMKPA